MIFPITRVIFARGSRPPICCRPKSAYAMSICATCSRIAPFSAHDSAGIARHLAAEPRVGPSSELARLLAGGAGFCWRIDYEKVSRVPFSCRQPDFHWLLRRGSGIRSVSLCLYILGCSRWCFFLLSRSRVRCYRQDKR